jgi:hypothetical protein
MTHALLNSYAENQDLFFHDFTKAYIKLQFQTPSKLNETAINLKIPVHENLVAEGTVKRGRSDL